VVTPTVSLDYSFWQELPHTKSKVRLSSLLRSHVLTVQPSSYISEAAASLMDTRLQLNIVPRTELVSISSPSFFYDWLDRVAYKQNRKPLPDKIGSFQFFLHGYTDSSAFLREHPWPGRNIADTFDEETHRTGMAASKRVMGVLNLMCGRTGEEEESDDLETGFYGQGVDEEPSDSHDFYWSMALQHDFRLELEKLIVLGTFCASCVLRDNRHDANYH
jgi:hypothetical protein